VKEILASHQPAPLSDEVRREMGELVAAYSDSEGEHAHRG
jgi:hypothetical protein